ncbi:MAG: hypothetical protein U1E26_11680 [Coriobacteriia bacterium]|nr:hypothetical protein [Coriobacteriia bacterium]
MAVSRKDGRITYFNGQMPVFGHDEEDVASFRMITSQFYGNGTVKQSDIVRVFGVAPITVKRAVKLYRQEGPSGFYREPARRGPAVMLPEVLLQAQALLAEGLLPSQVAGRLGLKTNTVQKALQAGRLRRPDAAQGVSPPEASALSTKSQRSVADQTAEMGVGATNTAERVAASLGLLQAVEPRFEAAADVANGGVLLALPALCVTGLLHRASEFLRLPKGYYGVPSLLLLLAFLALARVKSFEQLRYCAPGEWGKLLGLDRVPEVRTARRKVAHLCDHAEPMAWSAALCAEWMKASPEQAQILYVDGHVRVYHGDQTSLPRHYVSRQRLCLRATTDYWVNAMDGQPFFLVTQPVDPGLIRVLEDEILPRLEREVPGQATAEELKADRLLHRFTVVFDREGYSPELLRKLRERRIACLTYHKHPKAPWRDEEFVEREVTLVSGNRVSMRLAERGTWLSGKVWVRELRRLMEDGHQTAILSTDYRTDLAPAAAAMFARWSQENFFRYMREHYNLDRLIEYGTEELAETTRVINPEYRRLGGEIRRRNTRLSRAAALFGALTLDGELDSVKMEQDEQKKASLQEEMEHLQAEITDLKVKRKAENKHIPMSQLPEADRFAQLRTKSKHFIDTIKMVAYRAETAMAHVLREKMSRQEDARSLLRGIYTTAADLLPDEEAGTLTVRLHHLANRATAEAVRHLCAELTATEVVFPGTNLRLIYDLVSSPVHRGQEV